MLFKDSKPLISIITVVFNDCKNITKTIESVISQSYSNFEFIIIDGGSKDGTVEIIKQYESYITHFVSEKDNGIYDAMNKGVHLAQAKYLYFLNSGDYFCNSDVLKRLKVHLDGSYDLVYGSIIKLFPNFEVSIASELVELKNAKMPPHQASCIKRDLFIELGYYDATFISSGDFDLMCKILTRNYCSKKIDICVAYMLLGGMSSNKNISYSEVYQIINAYFGIWYSTKFLFTKIIIEQSIKKILLMLFLENIYLSLLKFKMKALRY